MGHSKGTSCRTPLAKILHPPLLSQFHYLLLLTRYESSLPGVWELNWGVHPAFLPVTLASSIAPSLVHSRLKTFSAKPLPPQHSFSSSGLTPRTPWTVTDTSEYIHRFCFFFLLTIFFSFGYVRYYVSFWANVKIESRIVYVSYRSRA